SRTMRFDDNETVTVFFLLFVIQTADGFRWFTYTKSNKMWKVGCFYGSGQELIEKAYQDSEQSGKCYEAYVNLVLELEKLDD
ncbi:hypothetical protein, partial [Parasutterella excrementihominis]|uniref:hypothetical protein n=1 Tax=Parasutterella excrementihominis TaxID=487175 RepID=UPI0019D658BF